jgi:autotransporter-associated beta strand protein
LGLLLQTNTHLNAASGNITVGGPITGAFSVTASGSNVVTLSGSNSYSGGTTVSAGKLVIGAAGALPANSNVSITGGTLQLGASTGGETLSGLSIAAGGSFDVNNNHVLLSYTAGTRAAADAAVLGYLLNGYNGGAWNGTSGSSAGGGIDSSAAAANHGYALGYADGADHVVTGLSSGQIEIKYTLLGDANLDGLVSGDDFTILVGNLGKSGEDQWDEGNFLYSSQGVITGDDFTALVSNLGKQANGTDIVLPASDYAAIDAYAAANDLSLSVPEPASIGFIALIGFGALGRRGRRRMNV